MLDQRVFDLTDKFADRLYQETGIRCVHVVRVAAIITAATSYHRWLIGDHSGWALVFNLLFIGCFLSIREMRNNLGINLANALTLVDRTSKFTVFFRLVIVGLSPMAILDGWWESIQTVMELMLVYATMTLDSMGERKRRTKLVTSESTT